MAVKSIVASFIVLIAYFFFFWLLIKPRHSSENEKNSRSFLGSIEFDAGPPNSARDLLDGYMSSIIMKEWDDQVLDNINPENFKYTNVLDGFNLLSEISFNFTDNSTDAKSFEVALSSIALNVKSAKDNLSNKSTSFAVGYKLLNYTYNLYNDQKTYKILAQKLSPNGRDLSETLQKIYALGQKAQYKAAGIYWGYLDSQFFGNISLFNKTNWKKDHQS